MPEMSSHRATLGDGRELSLTWAGATDVGRRREANQDAFLARFPLFVVADGMGGHAGGEIASGAAVERLREIAERGEVIPATIESALERAAEDILGHPEATDEGSGTTVTGIFLAEIEGQPQWMVLNIGDSRVYLLREGGLTQVTTDHSVVQELIASGRLSPEEAEGHPYSNVITRAVGAGDITVPDYVGLDLQDDDVFVVCSDGLIKELTDYGIQHFLTAHPEPDAAVEAMMSAALENGGRDNITIVVVRVAVADSSSTTGESDE